MKFFRRIFWLIWLWSTIFLVITFVYYKVLGLILIFVLFVSTGVFIYLHKPYKKSFPKVKKDIKSINMKPIEEEIEKFKKQEKECSRKFFILQTELDQYKLEQEGKYRDVVRKVLDLDNKLNKKFKLLGESIIKISKKKNS